MVITIMVLGLVLMGLSACEEKPAQEYGSTLTDSVEKADTAADAANLEALNKSIAEHHAITGAYPESIDGMAKAMGLDPSLYDYDSSTGRVAPK